MYNHISNVSYNASRREIVAGLIVTAIVSVAAVGFLLARFVA